MNDSAQEREDRQELASLLGGLTHTVVRLRYLRLVVALVSITNLAVVVISVLFSRFDQLTLTMILVIGCLGVATVVIFETTKKSGEAQYDEIRATIQRGDQTPQGSSLHSNLQFRLTLRRFSMMTDLPLVPGKYGPLFYAILNLLIPMILLLTGTRWVEFVP